MSSGVVVKGLSALWKLPGPGIAPVHVEASWTRDRTPVPRVGRQIVP